MICLVLVRKVSWSVKESRSILRAQTIVFIQDNVEDAEYQPISLCEHSSHDLDLVSLRRWMRTMSVFVEHGNFGLWIAGSVITISGSMTVMRAASWTGATIWCLLQSSYWSLILRGLVSREIGVWVYRLGMVWMIPVIMFARFTYLLLEQWQQ